MVTHVFFYRFKCLIRDRELVFWTLLFPILMATFFYLAFMNLTSEEAFKPPAVAVVAGGQPAYDMPFAESLKQVSSGKDRLFRLQPVSGRQEADRLLKQGKIAGYFTSGKKISLTVKEEGFKQSIMKSFADEYRAYLSAAGRIAASQPQALSRDDFGRRASFVRETAGGSAKPDTVLNYFYALIAMACLYGSFWGMKEIDDIQPNITARAARVNMGPVHKLAALMAGGAAALIILFTEMLLLLAFMRFALHIDFGPRGGYVLLTALLGSVLGLTFGMFTSALIKKHTGLKTAALIVGTMFGSFMAGMMYIDMKYWVAEYTPLLAWLNPVNLLTDAFYSLYYYDSLNRYALNMGMIGVFIIAFTAATYLIVRRRSYANL
ncbi:MAG: ABC transporter permease [Sporolactobacillus sp.]|jgi:ABC-2 type transport system permease protein|nr:ABC transporter permease [Sporolactobacillus sp.]